MKVSGFASTTFSVPMAPLARMVAGAVRRSGRKETPHSGANDCRPATGAGSDRVGRLVFGGPNVGYSAVNMDKEPGQVFALDRFDGASALPDVRTFNGRVGNWRLIGGPQ